MKNELEIHTVAKVQGWESDGFGTHVYRFVRMEMEAHRQSERKHVFYLFNPGNTGWYEVFEERRRARPQDP
jgi:hypothetical protein